MSTRIIRRPSIIRRKTTKTVVIKAMQVCWQKLSSYGRLLTLSIFRHQSMSGRLFFDRNQNNVYDSGLDNYVINQTIIVYRSSTVRRFNARAGNEIARFTTGPNGEYSFFIFATLLPYEGVTLTLPNMPSLPELAFSANGAGFLPMLGPLTVSGFATTTRLSTITTTTRLSTTSRSTTTTTRKTTTKRATTTCVPPHTDSGKRGVLPVGLWAVLRATTLLFAGSTLTSKATWSWLAISKGIP